MKEYKIRFKDSRWILKKFTSDNQVEAVKIFMSYLKENACIYKFKNFELI